jgi:hypothetical protein
MNERASTQNLQLAPSKSLNLRQLYHINPHLSLKFYANLILSVYTILVPCCCVLGITKMRTGTWNTYLFQIQYLPFLHRSRHVTIKTQTLYFSSYSALLAACGGSLLCVAGAGGRRPPAPATHRTPCEAPEALRSQKEDNWIVTSLVIHNIIRSINTHEYNTFQTASSLCPDYYGWLGHQSA